MHLQEIHYLTFWAKVTQNVVQHRLPHMTYAASKFEVAKSNGLGGGAFIRKCII